MVSKLEFNEEKHEYKVGDNILTSVTTFVKQFFPAFDAERISGFSAKKRQREGELNAEGNPITAEDVLAEWKLKGDIASSAGTLTHIEIEEFIKGNFDSVVMDVFTPKAKQGVKWFYKSPFASCKVEPELKVFDEELGLAGTIDLCVYNDDGSVTLIDWKTNKKITKKGYGKSKELQLPNANYYHYNLQLSIYAYILERQGYSIRELILPHLCEDEVHIYEMEYLKDIVVCMFEEEEYDEEDYEA